MINKYFHAVMPPVWWTIKKLNIDLPKIDQMVIAAIWGLLIIPLLILGAIIAIILRFI